MPDTHDKVASMILKQVPLARVGAFVKTLNAANVAEEDKGHGCGLGCATNGLDPHGLSGLTRAQLTTALSDKAGLKTALGKQIATMSADLN